MERVYICFNEEEVREKVEKLREKGIELFDIYVGRYWATDGLYHREIWVREKKIKKEIRL